MNVRIRDGAPPRGRRESTRLRCWWLPLAVAGSLAVSSAAAPRSAETEPHPAAPPSGPRIGLVLSGGGARGAAHVGVIEVLEELRVPVHCIAGTSMGAIVGGLYASGMSPAEMRNVLDRLDWRDVLDDRPPRRRLPYREKVDDLTFLARFEAGFNGGRFQLPPGLVLGQKMGFVLKTLAPRAIGVERFDDLPIPFRAVATDLETGEMVVLDHGDLAHAMRASMAIPGVISPFVLEGRLLADGGLVRNLPVDVVRAMGAEVVIAVDVGQPLLDRERLRSMVEIAGQMFSLQMRRNVEAQLSEVDVLVRPELASFGAAQFERTPEMVPVGAAAARVVAAELERYSVSEAVFRARLESLRDRSVPPARITAVQVTHTSSADPALILGRVRTRIGDPLDLEQIRGDLERLYATGEYERVDAHLSRFEDGYALNLEAHDKSWGPNVLRGGLNMVSDFEGESSFDLLVSYRMTRLNERHGEVKVQAQGGENPALGAELYQPLTTDPGWFAALQLGHAAGRVTLPAGGGLLAPYKRTGGELQATVGYQLGSLGELRLGLFRGRSAFRFAGDEEPPPAVPRKIRSDTGGIRFQATIDQLDNVNFPRHGYLSVLRYDVSREGLGADADYDDLDIEALGAVSRDRHTILGIVGLHTALGTDSPQARTLGGLFSLSGAPPGSIAGRYGGNASLLYLYRFAELPPAVGDGLYLGLSLEAGNLWLDAADVDLGDLRTSAALALGADTRFGPLYVAYGVNDHAGSAFYLYLGRSF